MIESFAEELVNPSLESRPSPSWRVGLLIMHDLGISSCMTWASHLKGALFIR